MACAPGFLYDFPWESWGSFKYLMYVPLAARAWYQWGIVGCSHLENICFHLLIGVILRYLLFQLWGSVSRLPYFSRKYQIVTKGIKFEQIDHEATWESMMIVTSYLIWSGAGVFLPKEGLPAWDWWGVPIVVMMHIGPIEWIYYWGHRALHHHFLFTRYHQHHHSSFVTQPITSSNHPFLEHMFYNVLFALPFLATIFLGHSSIGVFYMYVMFIDFMNSWGHCNFEFIPTWVFSNFPILKYFIYSPTYHSLHHTKVHTNFSLFMPLYDHLYGTVDATTDSLHQEVRKGHNRNVDCVYLTHATDLLSVFHLHFGFQTFAAQPYSKKWYMWMMWPIGLPLVLLAWLFAKPFAAASHFIGNMLELQTWVIPRISFQYSLSSEAEKISGWIHECILQAQQAGAKVFALGLLNKGYQTELDEVFLCKNGVGMAIVTGETLAAAIVAKKVEANHRKELNVFITSAQSRAGSAISIYLCKRGFRVLVLLPSKEHAMNLRNCVPLEFQDNLVHATNYDAGSSCKVWLVGEQVGHEVQQLAPRGAYFYPFDVFPIKECRKDCVYGTIPSLKLPKDAQNINACEDILPRNVVRASYAAAMVHAREGLRYHDFGGDISQRLMDESWELAMKHGFTVVNG
ncbi:hypothetical protein GOP47_0020982 [Adiantum capillus-veneris]|uniref:Uncharacterized protein n=1 Tax=Adiantum capillus-veneris TaxID=13818 RepID=A0A9D4Z887_ADICA|nr:hypothetical protein GOP47_0020982 [Adiantum capillus-veneris]